MGLFGATTGRKRLRRDEVQAVRLIPRRSAPSAGSVVRKAAFDLTTHKGLVAELVVLAAALCYAVAEFLLLSEYEWLGSMPRLPFVLVGGLTAAAVSHWAGEHRGWSGSSWRRFSPGR